MFYIECEAGYYTGRSGEAYVSKEVSKAFKYQTEQGAQHDADLRNRFTQVTGVTFNVVPTE